jgi:hypothetical protein
MPQLVMVVSAIMLTTTPSLAQIDTTGEFSPKIRASMEGARPVSAEKVSAECGDFVDVVVDLPKGAVSYDADDKGNFSISVRSLVGTTLFTATATLDLKPGTRWARHVNGLILMDQARVVKEIGPFDGWRDLGKVLVFVKGIEQLVKLTRHNEWIGLMMELPWTYSSEETTSTPSRFPGMDGRVADSTFGFSGETRDRRWLVRQRSGQPPTGYAWRIPAVLGVTLPPDQQIIERVIRTCPYSLLIRDSSNPPASAIK